MQQRFIKLEITPGEMNEEQLTELDTTLRKRGVDLPERTNVLRLANSRIAGTIMVPVGEPEVEVIGTSEAIEPAPLKEHIPALDKAYVALKVLQTVPHTTILASRAKDYLNDFLKNESQ